MPASTGSTLADVVAAITEVAGADGLSSGSRAAIEAGDVPFVALCELGQLARGANAPALAELLFRRFDEETGGAQLIGLASLDPPDPLQP